MLSLKPLVFFLLLVSLQGFAQKKEEFGIPTEKDSRIAEANYKCKRRNKYSTAERLKFYPFNDADKVVLISFNEAIDGMAIPVKGKVVDYSKVREKRILNEDGRNKLTDLLYNVGVTSNDYWFSIKDPGAKCYNPRNGILFLNKAGKAFEYIEICFECHRRELSSEKIKDGEYCDDKFDLMRGFFLKQGIRIGTVEELR